WPNHLTIAELLGTLTKPKREFFVGSYSHFLHTFRLPEPLQRDEDAISIVDWIDLHSTNSSPRHIFQSVISTGLTEVWRRAHRPNVLERFGQFVLKNINARSTLRHDYDLKSFE